MNVPPLINQWVLKHSHDREMLDALVVLVTTVRLTSAHSVSEKVFARFQATVALENVNEEKIANELYMSVRTLQRRLKQEQTSFRALLDSERQRRCQPYLKASHIKAIEVSTALGFDDVKSFYRAFKRWYGISFKSFTKSQHAV